MNHFILMLFVSFLTLPALAEMTVVEEVTETLKCSFPDETLYIQRSIPGVYPMEENLDRRAVDVAMLPGSPFTPLTMIDQGDELIFRDTLPGGTVIDYLVTFEPSQNGKILIRLSEASDNEVSSGSSINFLTDSNLMTGRGDSATAYGNLGGQAETRPITKDGVCQGHLNPQRYLR